MRKLIADWLMDLAFKIDPDTTVEAAKMLVTADEWARQMMALAKKPEQNLPKKVKAQEVQPAPKRKPGRPKGAKDGVGPKKKGPVA